MFLPFWILASSSTREMVNDRVGEGLLLEERGLKTGVPWGKEQQTHPTWDAENLRNFLSACHFVRAVCVPFLLNLFWPPLHNGKWSWGEEKTGGTQLTWDAGSDDAIPAPRVLDMRRISVICLWLKQRARTWLRFDKEARSNVLAWSRYFTLGPSSELLSTKQREQNKWRKAC